MAKQEKSLAEEISALLNRFSRENDSNTPDFILAEYLVACLCAFELASNRREVWYGVEHKPRESPLFQLHWEFSDRTEMKSQSDVSAPEEVRLWTKEVQSEFPLPDGAQWLMVNEKSEHFVWAVKPQTINAY